MTKETCDFGNEFCRPDLGEYHLCIQCRNHRFPAYTPHDAVKIALSVIVGDKTMDERDKLAEQFLMHLVELGYDIEPHMK